MQVICTLSSNSHITPYIARSTAPFISGSSQGVKLGSMYSVDLGNATLGP